MMGRERIYLFNQWIDIIDAKIERLQVLVNNIERSGSWQFYNDVNGVHFKAIEILDYTVSHVHHEIPKYYNNNDYRFGIHDVNLLSVIEQFNPENHINIILSSWQTFRELLNEPQVDPLTSWINLYHVTDTIAEQCGEIKTILRPNQQNVTGSISLV